MSITDMIRLISPWVELDISVKANSSTASNAFSDFVQAGRLRDFACDLTGRPK